MKEEGGGKRVLSCAESTLCGHVQGWPAAWRLRRGRPTVPAQGMLTAGRLACLSSVRPPPHPTIRARETVVQEAPPQPNTGVSVYHTHLVHTHAKHTNPHIRPRKQVCIHATGHMYTHVPMCRPQTHLYIHICMCPGCAQQCGAHDR